MVEPQNGRIQQKMLLALILLTMQIKNLKVENIISQYIQQVKLINSLYILININGF